MKIKNNYYEPDVNDMVQKLSEILVCKYLERRI